MVVEQFNKMISKEIENSGRVDGTHASMSSTILGERMQGYPEVVHPSDLPYSRMDRSVQLAASSVHGSSL